ncbi:MAG: hypothetical protein PHR68_02370 [Candidatus Gracilibacteria bacterium]|nr:hypothetical protein [Candidatus Gracilibacteria bacterium]
MDKKEILFLNIEESIKNIGYYPTKVKFGSREFYCYLCYNNKKIEIFFKNGFFQDEMQILKKYNLGEKFLNCILNKEFENDFREYLISIGITPLEIDRDKGNGGFEPSTLIMFLYYEKIISYNEAIGYIEKILHLINIDKNIIKSGFLEVEQKHALTLFYTFLKTGNTEVCKKLYYF